MAQGPNLSVRITSDLRDIKQGLAELNGLFAKTRKSSEQAASGASRMQISIDSAVKSLKQLAVGAAGAFGIGSLVQAFSGAARQASDFQTAIAEVSTLLSDTSGVDAMAKSVRDLARQYGQSPVEQAKALYQIISAGATDSAEALSILETANRLAIGGVTNVTIAADGLTSILNAYRGQVSGAAEVSDALFVAMRGGKTTIEELSRELGTVAPLASQTGVSFDELTAAVAAITTGGVRTNVAVTQLRAILANLLKPTKEAKDEAVRLGLEFDVSAIKAKGFAGFLDDVRERTGGSEASLSKLFGSVEGLGAVFALTGGQAEKFGQLLQDQANKTGETQRAFEKIAETPRQVFARLGAEVTDQLIKVGNSILQVLVPAAKVLAENFRDVLKAAELLTVYLVARFVPGLVLAGGSAITLTGIMAGLTKAVLALRTALVFLTGPAGLIALAITGIYALATAENEAEEATKKRKEAIDALNGSQGIGIQASIEAAKQAREQARADLDAAQAALAREKAILAANKNTLSARSAKDGTRGEVLGLEAGIAEREKQVDKLIDDIITLDFAILDGENRLATYLKKLEQGAEESGNTGSSVIAGVASSAELAKDAIQRALAELDTLLSQSQISLADYFDRKRQLQLESIDLAIAQAREEARLAETSEAQAKALTQIAILQRDRAEVGPRIAREQAAAEAGLAKSLQDVSLRLLELQGKGAEAALVRLTEQFSGLREKLIAEGNTAGLALIDRVINLEALKTRLQAFKDQAQQTLASLSSGEQSISAQVGAGTLGGGEGERQIQDLREKSLQQLRDLREAVAAYYAETEDPSVLAFLQELNGSIAQVEASQKRLRQQIEDQATSSLAGFFSDLATGAKSFKDAFLDMVRSFISGIAQMIAKELALKAVRSISGLVLHGGGIVGSGAGAGSRRALSPMFAALAGAGAIRRFHDGGFPGLKSDEVPAILQRGEQVLAKNDPRNALNGGNIPSRPAPGVRVVNVIDPSLAGDYIESADGERAILNVIGRNPGRVRQLIG